jgi:hypothetical protein
MTLNIQIVIHHLSSKAMKTESSYTRDEEVREDSQSCIDLLANLLQTVTEEGDVEPSSAGMKT